MRKINFGVILAASVLCSIPGPLLNDQTNRSFLQAPEVIRDPEASYKYSVHSRKFTGIPSMAITEGMKER